MAKEKTQAKERKLSANQEAFKNFLVEGYSQIDAYRKAYPKSKANPNCMAVEACKLSKKPAIEKAIAEIRAKASDAAQVTVESLVAEFEEARQVAKSEMSGSGMTAATMGKARVTGLDRQVVELQNAQELTPWSAVKAGIDAA